MGITTIASQEDGRQATAMDSIADAGLVDDFKSFVQNILRRKNIASADIDDLVNEVFYAFFSYHSRPHEELDIKKLLTTIANQKSIDHIRYNTRHKRDARRSLPLNTVDPAIVDDGVGLVDLQDLIDCRVLPEHLLILQLLTEGYSIRNIANTANMTIRQIERIRREMWRSLSR